MELGQRIRQARQEAGLSQRQLCGEEITRNMLSLIENGTARPSMDTLCYLARRLGKPVSWFLAEAATPNEAAMAEARACYSKKEYSQTLEILEQLQQPEAVVEQEYRLLYALAAMGAAEQAVSQGKKLYGVQLLEKAKQAGEKTPYFDAPLQRQWLLIMYKTGQADPKELAAQLPEDPQELLLLAEAAEDPLEKERFLNAVRHPTPYCCLLRGMAAMQRGDYKTAIPSLLAAENDYPKNAVPALEQCYRELEDYKQAYLYACKLRQL